MNATIHGAGVSGMSLYLPHPRVPLGEWCEWTGNPREKIEAVVGTGFRCPDIDEDVYTMAATAVLRLIRQYSIDPARVGFLGLGTESSKDNSAGAVILRGMLDRALLQEGLPALARDCEVPEFKHACLGGIYALKNAVRFARTEDDRVAIAVAADIAEYERGSSGEQTQGAGAVAMLIEPEARLFTLPLEACGSASQYRGPDFRKPFRRHVLDGSLLRSETSLPDYPVFSGRYSTFAYLDEMLWACRAMARRTGDGVGDMLRSAEAIFFHRPYHHMPLQGLAYLWLECLVTGSGDPELNAICEAAGVTSAQVAAELRAEPDLFAQLAADGEPRDLYPAATAAAAQLRRTDAFRRFVGRRMHLGTEAAREFGNLYSAALPAWLAAGLEQGLADERDLAGQTLLAVGYGSGDAAEAMPLRVVPGWEAAAARIDAAQAMAGAIDLDRRSYESLHDRRTPRPIEPHRSDAFAIAHVGETHRADFQDLGIDYYEFVPAGENLIEVPSASASG